MNDVGIFFSDFFMVDEEIIEEYGAVNISLINDLPLNSLPPMLKVLMTNNFTDDNILFL